MNRPEGITKRTVMRNTSILALLFILSLLFNTVASRYSLMLSPMYAISCAFYAILCGIMLALMDHSFRFINIIETAIFLTVYLVALLYKSLFVYGAAMQNFAVMGGVMIVYCISPSHSTSKPSKGGSS